MTLPPAAVVVLVVVFGFLTSSSVYFYNQSRATEVKKKTESTTFQAELPQLTASEQARKVDELTKPAEIKGRLSYPANTYTVEAKETLFGIGKKFGIDWQLLKRANGVSNENLVQAGNVLVIPKLEPTSDRYRITFKLNEDKASQLNRDLGDKETDASFQPIEVAKRDALVYFNITASDEFSLLEQDVSQGTALVEAKSATGVKLIGLFQPKEKGKSGFWALLYIEEKSIP